MPKINPGLIEAIGAQSIIHDLLRDNITDPTEIADRLNQEPSLNALAKGQGRKGIIAADVKHFLQAQGKVGVKGDLDSESKALQESPRAQALVQSVKDRVTGLIRQAETSEYLLNGTLRDVESLQRKWRDADEMGTEGNEYPVKEITALCRIIETQLKTVSAIKGDDKVTQLMRANTVNVSQGITQEEVFDIVFGVCELLGHDRQSILSAYSKYMGRSKPIPVEAIQDD